MAAESEVVTPGTRLGHVGAVRSGAGTYVLGDFVYASLVGRRTEVPAASGDACPLVEVRHSERGGATRLPQIGDGVLARVSKINPRFASVEILCVGDEGMLSEPLGAIIRARDVRAFEVDTVEMYKSFRPGDVVRAEVLSLGDSRSYYLSTARNELGVILAESSAGHTMVPVSWQHMLCPVTMAKEHRKVAKVDGAEGAAGDDDAQMKDEAA